jgi:hypothetical protein
MSTRSIDDSLRIPAALRHDVEQIFKLTDPFCAEHLDAEYGELVRKLVAKLARKRPSPFLAPLPKVFHGSGRSAQQW